MKAKNGKTLDARVRIRARVAKCTWRRAGALAYRYTPQVPKNSRELSEESRRFFLICPHGFHTVEGAKVASARGEGNKERTKIDSAACPLLQKRHLLDHRAHFSPVNKHYPVQAGGKSAARRKQGISRSLPFPGRPTGNEGAPLLTTSVPLLTKNKESVSELAFDTDSFHLINFCC